MNRSKICNFADDIIIYLCDSKVKSVIESLEQDATELSTWYPENCEKLNVNKCHLMIFGEKNNKVRLHTGEAVIEESDKETLIGITLDRKLSFKTHVQSLFKKVS